VATFGSRHRGYQQLSKNHGENITSDMRPLSILQINTGDIFGGAEKVSYELFRGYRARGHRSWLAVKFKFSGDPDVFPIRNDDYRKRWARTWLSIENILSPVFKMAPRLGTVRRWIAEPGRMLKIQQGQEDFDFPGSWHILELSPERPDLLHLQNLHGGYFDLRALPWLSQQVPVVVTLNDAWLLSGHCAHSFECERWRRGCGHCPDLTIYPAIKGDATDYNWHRKDEIYAHSRLHIAAPSQWLMNKAKESMLVQAMATSRVIPNGIDLRVFSPGNKAEARKALKLEDNATIILLIAHNPFKDYKTMESALSLLNQNTDDQLIFVCLGRTGVNKSVGQGFIVYRGLEQIPERMALYYRACDVYIHAAKDEAFGMTVTEALACGTPVVATAVGGIKEQLEDGVNGFLVSPRDPEAMASRVHQLLTDKELCRRIVIEAQESARRRFDLNHQIENYLKWYREILQLNI
jgi:glycosyltransferase involved in cell wall biosynthesis